jgi:uncharacterized DUF497 family protein
MLKHPSMRSLMEALNPSSPEHWETIEILGVPTQVGWQMAKEQSNRADHDGLSLRDGIPVIANPLAKEALQQLPNEERNTIIGPGSNQHILVVVVEWIEPDETVTMPAVRIISVRLAEGWEVRAYQGDHNMNEDQQRPDQSKPIDPDNPPLKPDVVFVPWRDQFLKRVAAFKAKVAARKSSETQNPNS